MGELDDMLKHSGVKGMKWGVIRGKNGHGEDHIVNDEKIRRTKLGQKLDSLKRERQWHKVLKEMDKLSTQDINAVSKRVGLENSLKTLSKEKFATSKDKHDYLRRGSMDTAELLRKVNRLRAKEALYKNVKSASKEQRDFGIKIARITGSMGVKYALTRKVPGPKDIFKDIFNMSKDSKDASNKAKESILKSVPDGSKRDVLNYVLTKIDKADKN